VAPRTAHCDDIVGTDERCSQLEGGRQVADSQILHCLDGNYIGAWSLDADLSDKLCAR
jgi:hypothetical protein